MANPAHDHLFVRRQATEESGESWWIGLSREAFYTRLRVEQERITESRFGRAAMLMTATDTSSDDDRWRRARRVQESGS